MMQVSVKINNAGQTDVLAGIMNLELTSATFTGASMAEMGASSTGMGSASMGLANAASMGLAATSLGTGSIRIALMGTALASATGKTGSTETDMVSTVLVSMIQAGSMNVRPTGAESAGSSEVGEHDLLALGAVPVMIGAALGLGNM
jgi:hypothetical protein